jgi:hypothetical protein
MGQKVGRVQVGLSHHDKKTSRTFDKAQELQHTAEHVHVMNRSRPNSSSKLLAGSSTRRGNAMLLGLATTSLIFWK